MENLHYRLVIFAKIYSTDSAYNVSKIALLQNVGTAWLSFCYVFFPLLYDACKFYNILAENGYIFPAQYQSMQYLHALQGCIFRNFRHYPCNQTVKFSKF